MGRVAVIVCSNAGLDYINHKYKIDVFRSVILFGDKKYDDYVELKAEEFYEIIANDKSSFPHTAYVSLGHMIETFEKLKSEGYTDVLVITIAIPLSGLNEGVKLAAKDVCDETFKVHSYNSRTLAYPEAYMALEAARMADEGKEIEEIIARMDYVANNNHIYFAVDTLDFLIKNGRLGKVSGTIAQMLSIRPLLDLDPDGRVRTVAKTRTSKKARSLMIETFLEEIKDLKNIEVFLIDTNNKPAIEETRKIILEARPDLLEIKDYLLTPVVGAHAGPGTIGLGYMKK